MVRAYRDTKKYYGNPSEKRCFTPNNTAGPSMTRKQQETPYLGVKEVITLPPHSDQNLIRLLGFP